MTLLMPICCTAAAAEAPQPPATQTRQVSDAFHGTTVAEDYRWLEESANPAVKQWSDAQNEYSRSILDQLPNRVAIDNRFREIMSA